jgi:transposase
MTGRKGVYFRETTYPQRRMMIDAYLETGNATEAAAVAHVSRHTFYRWWNRYKEGGGEAIKRPKSKRPHHLRTVPEYIAKRVVELKTAHPSWGQQRIADEMAKENKWTPVISDTGVRNVLIRAGIIKTTKKKPKPKKTKAVTADEPGKTVNIDLFFVPESHEAEDRDPPKDKNPPKEIDQPPH